MKASIPRLRFYSNCTEWPGDPNDPEDLCEMVELATEVTRRTFMGHVNLEDLRHQEAQCSYARHPSQGLTMAGDWHVAYWKSKLYGKTVYYFTWSAIEYVFTEENRRGENAIELCGEGSE